MLEIVNFTENIDDIGGLENLKEWLARKAKVFANLDKAIKFGVDVPKGIMIIGMPGCGKSLTAKATASLFEISLVRLDVGRLLGKYVGESEENMRKALKFSEAISPCVLWIDEIEKELGGTQGRGEADGGVGNRILARLLNWMQESDRQCLVFATANRIQNLPRELIRAGRISKKFYTFLPMHEECVAILRQIIRKEAKESPGLFQSRWIVEDLETFGDAVFDYAAKFENKFYTGADIESLVREALSELYQEGYVEPVGRELFQETVALVNDFKNYFMSHGQAVYENPSPGNKKGGISTLEDKSLGCTQKSGSAPVRGVLAYGERVTAKGLNLLSAPGNDLVASTALAAAGAQIVLFTTGRGTPFACPVPTVKISSNTPLSARKKNWIDFDCGSVTEGKALTELGDQLFEYVLAVACGKKVKAEEAGFHDMAIFKQGVTL